ncbi:unnamed protein product (macronuclear) [Paramecium tetraurelia]|uniref:TOG domain-containing protein n=1 Tax=Paramecium tetraurelia TaxID=5888 RepID=A0CCJ6_PARTE|nr:uncharacterized protein GSPATT00037298001 [Paramecium tetraurelia]CAK68513.1 unnamed protein product [Paramecium tetraurelia]|eukprot:XP_001435910.1 hypothetical protein (macronuclear) [Paramecium tetraurelia strain d4-2]
MLNELIQLFCSNGTHSSELFYNATLQLNEFLDKKEIVRCFPRVSENLGDQLPNLRKASHQLFQAYIRFNESFDGVLSAMLSRGLIHPNWLVRQKNVNSLQSLFLSEGQHLESGSGMVKNMVEMLLGKLCDCNLAVCKATEQTLITLISLNQYKQCHAQLPMGIQSQVEQFVEQMKETNQIRQEIRLREPTPNGLPFDKLEDLKDTQWQMRAEAIQRIYEELQDVILTPLQVEVLFEHIVNLVNDHNFNIVLTTLQIMQRCLQFNIVKSSNIVNIYTKLGDSKSAIRTAVRQVLVMYLQKIGDGELLIQILQWPNKNSFYKEECLDLLIDLVQRNKMLLSQHLELAIKEVAPFLEDQKQKLRSKAIDTLTQLATINQHLTKRVFSQLGITEDLFNQIDVSTASSNKSDLPQLRFKKEQRDPIDQYTQSLPEPKHQQQFDIPIFQSQQQGYVPTIISQPQKQQRSAQKTESHPQSSSIEFRQAQQQQEYNQPPATQQSKPFRIVKNPQQDIPDQDTGLTYTKPFQRKPKTEADKTFQPIYLDEVLPLDQPESVLKSLLNELRYDDWNRQFEALNNLRRLAKHNSELLRKSVNFPQILLEMVKQIENLRSGVSKNALISLQELSDIYKKDLDCVLDQALQKLIKKAIDLNTFISEEVRKSTISLLQNCSEQKSISLITQVYQSKSIAIKVNICYALNNLLDPNKQSFEKMLQILCLYACDQGQEVRQIAKEGLLSLIGQIEKRELESLIIKLAPEGECKRIMTIINGESTTTSEFRRFGATQTKEARTPELRNRTPNNKKLSADFEQMPNYMNQAELGKDWKQKKDAIDWLCNFAKKEAQALNGHKYSNKFLDLLCKLIDDGNKNIALYTCEQFIQLVEPLKLPIQNNYVNIWNGVFKAVSSTNNQVRQSAESLFHELMIHIDIQYSLPQIQHLILYGPAKSKGIAITMLANFVQQFYDERPQLVVKHLVPLAKKLQEEQKPDIKIASQKLFQALVSTCPNDVAHLKLLK